MMKYLTKLVYNIKSNLLTKIYVEPVNMRVSVPSTSEAAVTTFVKSGNVENFYYEVEQIYPEDLSDNNTKYL